VAADPVSLLDGRQRERRMDVDPAGGAGLPLRPGPGSFLAGRVARLLARGEQRAPSGEPWILGQL
ncbi:hypothetical protein ACPXCX_46215, partial [Streptomyces sp. DT225]